MASRNNYTSSSTSSLESHSSSQLSQNRFAIPLKRNKEYYQTQLDLSYNKACHIQMVNFLLSKSFRTQQNDLDSQASEGVQMYGKKFCEKKKLESELRMRNSRENENQLLVKIRTRLEQLSNRVENHDETVQEINARLRAATSELSLKFVNIDDFDSERFHLVLSNILDSVTKLNEFLMQRKYEKLTSMLSGIRNQTAALLKSHEQCSKAVNEVATALLIVTCNDFQDAAEINTSI